VLQGGPRTNPGGIAGNCTYERFNLTTGANQHRIFAAGSVAQAVALYGRNPTPTQLDGVLGHNKSDIAKLRQFALTASVSDSVNPHGLAREVLPLVLRYWPAIAALATQIYQQGPISHEDVTKALRLSEDQSRHPFEIANIHAGLSGIPSHAECSYSCFMSINRDVEG